ncbi:fimbrial assembly protein [Cellulomonas triticagri]|uniref:Fimbrial assembly protein n=1 Tax=Cellulomonas triticagri TaxID=2483352 RepID=A0A3M2JHN4_9CELL|nr:fimbrial assembly protein [Cellulomonas triticagri]RMI13099.1 fimbrial assembly protein [Cellulomonas triticagri]
MSVTAPTRRPDAAPVDTWPQVNLLPAEVTQGRRLKSTKRLLVLALAVVLLVIALGYVGSLFLARHAASELTAAQAETTRLQDEKAQYAEVPQVLSDIATAEIARQQAMSSEILWPDYLEALRAVTPEGVSYDSISVAVGAPGQPYGGSTNPLSGTTIGQVAFTARSLTLPDTAAWIDAIEGVSGMSNPWFSSASISEEDGVVFYQVQASVDLLPSALSGRFEPEVEQ